MNKSEHLSYIESEIESRKKSDQYRSLESINPGVDSVVVKKNDNELINFSSNDYLGLSKNRNLIDRSCQYARKYGSGSTASRLICGSFEIHSDLEKKISDFTGREAALIFNSGFQANSTIISTLAGRNSLIIADKLSHNSIIQGALLSRGKFQRYRHNDMDHLEQLLESAASRKQPPERIWIVTESIFSMDGDKSNLDEIMTLSEKYEVSVFVDEAHAVGLWGREGRGLAYGMGRIDLVLGTFGKAFGSFGAFVACSEKIKNYLVNFCPGFIFTTALPPAIIGSIDAALDLIPELDRERSVLKNTITDFRRELTKLGYNTGLTSSQIIPILIGNNNDTLNLSGYLENNGILATAIRPPTVPENSSRIRVTLTSEHTQDQINRFLHLLGQWRETHD